MLDFSMIAADTTRTRVYLDALNKNNLLPSEMLILPNKTTNLMHGQINESAYLPFAVDGSDQTDFDLLFKTPLDKLAEIYSIPFTYAASSDINSGQVVNQISDFSQEVLIYSGYGGVILKDSVLNIGKKFLHVHGGFLPDYKGSTTNYFSILSAKNMGASAIFLTNEIDCGPILLRKQFDSPINKQNIDHITDSLCRADVLIEVLDYYRQHSNWPLDTLNIGGDTYYVIHPILKHLAILSDS